MRQDLLDKYNVQVPRYTSYPPANYFHDNITPRDYRYMIEDSNDIGPKELSFYFHIPFCFKLCHYCGCNSYPISSPDIIDRYLNALHLELEMVTKQIHFNRSVSQIHYGGGTPSLLPIPELGKLNQKLRILFYQIENPEIAIECHPGWMTENSWRHLRDANFTRISLGIQDFNKQVLQTVNRRSPLLKVENIMSILREQKMKVNMDFLYGLPHQTEKSFADTIRRAVDCGPDRLVTFSYAHVPWAFPRQKVLESAGLPSSDEKSRMYETAYRILCDAGYKPIGLDHFVREDDELYTAQTTGQLHRNFQGYCTRRTTGQVYALGVTGISQLSTGYAQNTKDIAEYIEKVEKGIFPVAKGYFLSEEEQITREVIEKLMCNYYIDWEELAGWFNMAPEDVKKATAYNEHILTEFANDGIIDFDNRYIQMTDEGALFVRNVAASLDKLMLQTDKSFSKPV